MSKNWYCEVLRFAAKHSPVVLSLLLKLIVKDPSTSILPRHVFSLASIYAQIGQEVDKANNSLSVIQAISLKMEGLSDRGLAGQARVKLSLTERALRYKRDELAEVQTCILIEESRRMPSQITLDQGGHWGFQPGPLKCFRAPSHQILPPKKCVIATKLNLQQKCVNQT